MLNHMFLMDSAGEADIFFSSALHDESSVYHAPMNSSKPVVTKTDANVRKGLVEVGVNRNEETGEEGDSKRNVLYTYTNKTVRKFDKE